MKSMDKLTTGIAYGTSAGSAGYWFLQWLYFKIKEDKRKAARGE